MRRAKETSALLQPQLAEPVAVHAVAWLSAGLGRGEGCFAVAAQPVVPEPECGPKAQKKQCWFKEDFISSFSFQRPCATSVWT